MKTSTILVAASNKNDYQRLINKLDNSEIDYRPIFTDSSKALSVFLKKSLPDIILFDIKQEPVSDFLIDEVQKISDPPFLVPIIFLTNNKLSEFNEILKTGIVDFIHKPIDDDELNTRIKRAIYFCKQQRESDIEKNELLELNSLKDEFFSIIARDLKEPFTTLIGLSDLIVQRFEQLDKQKLQRFNNLINRSSHYAYSLLENLLIWSKIQTNGLIPNPESFTIKPVIHSAVLQYQGHAASKKIITDFRVANDDLKVYADKSMIKNVLANLISNAIKFTNEGGKVFINAYKKDDTVEIQIKDSGIGINEEDMPKLFRIDIRRAMIGDSPYKGSGLGLILCKEFITRNKGEIWASSEKNRGSTFTFSLPLGK